ncbi:DUF6446 family protein [Psychromarinibacter sp. C21-152]|uniref:DUF6446 family protein n=1 Tax=Psychromarinibacter sediminicola TaxID=3033385 RepID=A0AAE3NSU1_9RHOB|nr:DUF6446 family protein [Psychromarinibacter sediminicola]MDF0601004.1 DUF6446 family protein [Psychromarinibacter sediminicola]
MTGKLIGGLIVGFALIAGVSIYYLQVYAYYMTLAPEDVDIRLTSVALQEPEPIRTDAMAAIDSDSSPLRFRACFETPRSLAALTEQFVIYDAAEPLNAPNWFDCFDAETVGLALERGEAIAFLGERDIHDGVDRVVAVFDDGRAYAWHQLNETYQD